MNNLIFLAVAIPVLMLLVPNVYAGGPRNDSSSDLPGALACWSDGFDDGANSSFDDARDNECKNIDDQYSKGFEAGNRLGYHA
jgi:hypothetical protein